MGGLDIAGLGSVADFAKSIVTRIFPERASEAEKMAATAALTNAIEKREADVIASKKDVMVAEMAQGDTFTKRARPMIVYTGLAVIVLNHVVLPWLAWGAIFASKLLDDVPEIDLPLIVMPENFWYVWGGVCSVWIWGRTKEKIGANSNILDTIMGR